MDQLGHEKFRGVVGRGGAIGLLAISCRESSLIRVQALEPSIVVSITFDQLLEFGSRSKAFQMAVLELTADLFVRVSAAQRKSPSPGTVAIVHRFICNSQARQRLHGDTQTRSPQKKTLFSTIQVIMRQAIVQNYSMNAIGVSPADFVLAPDVTDFDISEFTRADEMAEIGNKHVMERGSELRKQLQILDPQLFLQDSASPFG